MHSYNAITLSLVKAIFCLIAIVLSLIKWPEKDYIFTFYSHKKTKYLTMTAVSWYTCSYLEKTWHLYWSGILPWRVNKFAVDTPPSEVGYPAPWCAHSVKVTILIRKFLYKIPLSVEGLTALVCTFYYKLLSYTHNIHIYLFNQQSSIHPASNFFRLTWEITTNLYSMFALKEPSWKKYESGSV